GVQTCALPISTSSPSGPRSPRTSGCSSPGSSSRTCFSSRCSSCRALSWSWASPPGGSAADEAARFLEDLRGPGRAGRPGSLRLLRRVQEGGEAGEVEGEGRQPRQGKGQGAEPGWSGQGRGEARQGRDELAP